MDNFECTVCGESFHEISQCNKHMVVENHWPFECFECGGVWPTEEQRDEHVEEAQHWPFKCLRCLQSWPTWEAYCIHQAEVHCYCSDCSRCFPNIYRIRQHFANHHREPVVECLLCKTRCTTDAEVVHHLGSGGCHGARGLSRAEIYSAVMSKDPGGALAKSIIGWRGSDYAQCRASERSWNGSAYECLLCNRTFRELGSLNQHLNSATHQEAVHRCPNSDCGSDFESLGDIISHLEGELCGFTRFGHDEDEGDIKP